jgi:hypothetical protein
MLPPLIVVFTILGSRLHNGKVRLKICSVQDLKTRSHYG